MKVVKYKFLGNGKYRVNIDNQFYVIYEDIIIKYSILNKNEITEDELKLYLKDNSFYEAYYKGISYINIKLRSEYELNNYLEKYFDTKIVKEAILKLKADGYLNEDIYAESYINDQINLKISGPLKIKRDLVKFGIDVKYIDKHLSKYSKELQCEKINKVIEKEVKLNKKNSVIVLKNKILKSLIDKGFYKEDIVNSMNFFEFNDKEIYENEYKRLYDKLSKKYSGNELEYKIKAKLYQKGFKV